VAFLTSPTAPEGVLPYKGGEGDVVNPPDGVSANPGGEGGGGAIKNGSDGATAIKSEGEGGDGLTAIETEGGVNPPGNGAEAIKAEAEGEGRPWTGLTSLYLQVTAGWVGGGVMILVVVMIIMMMMRRRRRRGRMMMIIMILIMMMMMSLAAVRREEQPGRGRPVSPPVGRGVPGGGPPRPALPHLPRRLLPGIDHDDDAAAADRVDDGDDDDDDDDDDDNDHDHDDGDDDDDDDGACRSTRRVQRCCIRR
jgi:hypothetical protein